MEHISHTLAKRDPVPPKSDVARGTPKRRRAKEILVAKNPKRKRTLTHLIQVRATTMLAATIRPTARKLESSSAKVNLRRVYGLGGGSNLDAYSERSPLALL